MAKDGTNRGGKRNNAGRKKQEKIPFVNSCENCGASFKTFRRETKTCSKECFSKLMERKTSNGWQEGLYHNEKTLKPAICLVCGEIFQPKASNQKCCSKQCGIVQMTRTNSIKPRMMNTCEECGRTFVNKYRHKVKFCSDECRTDFKEKQAQIKQEAEQEQRQKQTAAICLFCGKDFEKKNGNQKYCSPYCAKEGINKRLREQYKSVVEGKEIVCKECGKVIVLEAYQKVKAYCSDECRRKATRRKGHNNRKWIQWKPIIFERDKGICQLCGYPVDKEDVETIWQASLDHILPRSKGGTDSPENLRLVHLICNSLRGNDENKNEISNEELLLYM